MKDKPTREIRDLLLGLEKRHLDTAHLEPPYVLNRDDVEAELLRQIDTGELWVTELLCQRAWLRDLIGEVILGFYRTSGRNDPLYPNNPAGQQVTVPVNPTIASHTVKVRALPRITDVAGWVTFGPSGVKETIKWTDGMRKLTPREMATRYPVRRPVQQQYTENIIDTGLTEAELPLREAWFCLKAHGKGVRFTLDATHRAMWELYEEDVPPLPAEGEVIKPKRRWFGLGKDKDAPPAEDAAS